MINISFWNIVFTVINLLILFVAVRIFFFKPIKKIIEDRQKEADEMFDKATEQEKNADDLKHQYEDQLKSAETEKRQILADARKNADVEYEHIIEDAKKDAAAIHDKAVADATHDKEEIINSARKEVAGMVIDAASKVVGTQSGVEVDKELFDQFLNKAGE